MVGDGVGQYLFKSFREDMSKDFVGAWYEADACNYALFLDLSIWG